MTELSEQLNQLKRNESKVTVATLVNTRGTTPRKEGAKMLVGEGGRVLGSVTIGGCVDAQVIEESADVLGKNAPRLLELNLGDEEAWEIGLTCGGTIEVFLEPVTLDDKDDTTLAYYERARVHSEQGGRAVIVTRLDAPHNGAKLLLLDHGKQEGTLGDTFLDQRFAAEAMEAMASGKSRTLFLENVRAFAEVFAPPSTLVVVGASHVAMPLVTLARTLGFRTIVVDGRPRFATKERFPDVDEQGGRHLPERRERAQHAGGLHRAPGQHPPRGRDPEPAARGRRGRGRAAARAGPDRPRPGRPVRARDRAEHSGRGARDPSQRDRDADLRESAPRPEITS